MKNTKGILYIVLSSLSFGVMPILAKLAYRQGLSTYTVLFLRFSFAALMLLVYLMIKKISFKLNRKQLFMVVILGIFGYSATALSLFISYKYISAGLATNILYIYPVIVTISSYFVYKDKLNLNKFAALFLCIAGVFTMAGKVNGSFNPIGIIFALMSAVFYSFYVMGTSHSEVKKINSYLMTFYLSIVSSIVMFSMGAATHTLNFGIINAYGLTCVLFLALISTVVALMAFLEGVRLIGPANASILSTLEPVGSLVLGWLVLNEGINAQTVFGCVLILSSVLVLTRANASI
jgi:drug/metabolite transporter (DMT)-like permease